MAEKITIRELLVKLGFEADTTGVDSFEGQVEGVGESLGGLADKAKGFALAFGASMAAAFGVSAIHEFLDAQLEAVTQIERRRAAIGATAEEIQQLGYVASESGTDMDTLQEAVADLSEKAADAAINGGGFQSTFDRLGISIRDTGGKIKKPLDLFYEFSDAMAAMPDGAEKTFTAMDLMSTEGAFLIPLMDKGSSAIKGMMTAANGAGAVMSDKTVSATMEYGEAARGLTRQLTALKSQALDALLPPLTGMINVMVAWISNSDNVAAALMRLKQALAVVGAALVTMAWPKLFAALTRIPSLAGKAISGLRALRMAIFSAQGAFMALPIAIAAVALGIQDLFTWVSGGDSLIGRFIDRFAESDGILGGVARSIQSLRPLISDLFAQLAPIISKILPAIASLLSEVFGRLVRTLGPAIMAIVGELGGIIKDFGPLIAEVAGQIGAIAGKIFVMAAKVIGVLLSQVFPLIKSMLPIAYAVIGGILSLVGELLPAVSVVLTGVTALIKGIAPVIQGLVTIASALLVGLAGLIARVIEVILGVVAPAIEWVSAILKVAFDGIGDGLEVLVGWFRAAFKAINGIIKPVTDAISETLGSVGKVTGLKNLMSNPFKAAGGTISQTVTGGQRSAGAVGGAVNVGGVAVSVQGSTNMGPSELRQATRQGTLDGILDAQNRAAARAIA